VVVCHLLCYLYSSLSLIIFTRPSQLASIIRANTSSAAGNDTNSILFKYKFSAIDASREGLGFGYYTLIAVTADGKLPVGLVELHGVHFITRVYFTKLQFRRLFFSAAFALCVTPAQTPVTINVSVARCAKTPVSLDILSLLLLISFAHQLCTRASYQDINCFER
jgi:hypothetical protein